MLPRSQKNFSFDELSTTIDYCNSLKKEKKKSTGVLSYSIAVKSFKFAKKFSNQGCSK